jgi:peptide/nickel transport system ATP-binding protein
MTSETETGKVQAKPEPILQIKKLCIDYPIAIGTVQAVRDVSIDLYDGEALGLVGESGCGKSTLGLAILDLVREPGKIASGEILYHGRDILKMPKAEVLALRGQGVAMVFQNPLTSLNPLMKIKDHFLETIQQHKPDILKKDALRMTAELLEELGIDKKRMDDYPHQLSGGMRQRIMIALGLIMNPDIIIADEPTTSLDVIVEAGFVDLLNRLRMKFELSIILITHNLGLVAEIADRIVVMYGGKIMEEGTAEMIFHRPYHPYTAGLINCVPNIDVDQAKLTTMAGSPPDLVHPPKGCRFQPRCPKALERCAVEEPQLLTYRDGRRAACWLYPEEF